MYFDNAATTKVSEKIIPDLIYMMTENYGNASSLHIKGIKAEEAVNESRKILSGLLNISRDEIYFTSGGTESNNIAVIGAAQAYCRSGRHIITSSAEHPSVLECFKHLGEQGFKTTFAPVTEKGSVDADIFCGLITDETTLVSLMHINNETGAVNDIHKIGSMIKKLNPKIKFHVDAVQSFGKIKINMEHIDLLSISAHKINGLKGAGALYIKRGTNIRPLFFGGGQEKNMRPGTENTPGILSLGLAAREAYAGMEKNQRHVSLLRDKLLEAVYSGLARVNGDIDNGSPYILNLSFEGVKPEVLVHALANEGVYASAGSACSSRVKKKPGNKDTVRFSFCAANTLEEVQTCLDILHKIVPALKM